MIIKEYEESYRDDLIFMILSAKDALGRKPGINEDLLHIKENYFNKGGNFWIAIDDSDRVIGSIGYSIIEGTTEAFIHRLFIKPSLKRQGLGTKLLLKAEEELKLKGITIAKVHLGEPEEQWFESYNFYPKHGYVFCGDRLMMKGI